MIAATTAAKLPQGVEPAGDTNRRARQSFVYVILATVPVEECTGRGHRAGSRAP
ncbi:hypothetical protein [Streptomyces sp. CL7]|uniref:hypothetical protein n=1 Tax=Streptomyces sp. CL7 TaxID=3096006 RepID=UPI002A75A0F5|nr:hypothetical protein [Streptomyces sp. CL7]WPP29697.1 hypothetical protein SJH97_10270 [Streptomyces sp. CL7]